MIEISCSILVMTIIVVVVLISILVRENQEHLKTIIKRLRHLCDEAQVRTESAKARVKELEVENAALQEELENIRTGAKQWLDDKTFLLTEWQDFCEMVIDVGPYRVHKPQAVTNEKL